MKKLYSLIAIIMALLLTAVPAFAAEPASASASELVSAPAPTQQEQMQPFKEAYARFAEARSSEMNGTVNMTLTVDGEATDIHMDIDVKQLNRADGSLEMIMVMTMKELEIDPITVYVRNGYYYYDMGEQQFKVKMPELPLDSENAWTKLGIAEEDLITNLEFIDVENGSAMRYQIPAESMNLAVNGMLATMFSTTPELAQANKNANYDFSDVTYTTVLNSKGDLYSQTMKFGFVMTMDGQALGIDLSMRLRTVSTNSILKLNFPEGLHRYPTVAM